MDPPTSCVVCATAGGKTLQTLRSNRTSAEPPHPLRVSEKPFYVMRKNIGTASLHQGSVFAEPFSFTVDTAAVVLPVHGAFL
jgi:hypothetical protein